MKFKQLPQLFKYSKSGECLFIPDKESSSVVFMVLFRIGSRFEAGFPEGIAHFVEHTMFKGTKTWPNGKKIAMEIELLGAETNAFTSYEYTGYYIKAPRIHAQKAFKLLSSIIQEPLFPDQDLEKEKGVVKEEIKMYEDIPMQRIRRDFMRKLYQGSSLAHDITGDLQSVGSIQRKECVQFVEEFYNQANSLLVVSGNIAERELKHLIESNLTKFQAGRRREPVQDALTLKKVPEFRETINATTSQAHIVMGGLSHARGYEHKYAQKVGAYLLGNGFGSKLFQIIREKYGLAYYVNLGLSEFADTGKFSIHLGVDASKISTAISAVEEELAKFAAGEFSDRDLERARSMLTSDYTIHLDSAQEKAEWYGLKYLLEGQLGDLDEVQKIITQITKEQVLLAWQDLLQTKNLNFLILTNTKLATPS